jgi:ABC-type transporter Mla MlaB component
MTANDDPSATGEERPGPSRAAMRPIRDRPTTVVVLSGRISPEDIPALSDRVRGVLGRHDCNPVICDVMGLARPDAVIVDALARLQLSLRRSGHRVALQRASEELQDLLALMGLDHVLPCDRASGREPRWQVEEREQAGGVEEEADPGDPAV